MCMNRQRCWIKQVTFAKQAVFYIALDIIEDTECTPGHI